MAFGIIILNPLFLVTVDLGVALAVRPKVKLPLQDQDRDEDRAGLVAVTTNLLHLQLHCPEETEIGRNTCRQLLSSVVSVPSRAALIYV